MDLVPAITKAVRPHFEDLIIQSNFRMIYNTITYYIAEKRDIISRIRKLWAVHMAKIFGVKDTDGLLYQAIPNIYVMHVVCNDLYRLHEPVGFRLFDEIEKYGIREIQYHEVVNQEDMLRNVRRKTLPEERYLEMYTSDGKRRQSNKVNSTGTGNRKNKYGK